MCGLCLVVGCNKELERITQYLACIIPAWFLVSIRDTVQRETFEGENFCGSVRSDHFAEKTFVEC